jgi:hypothetical protein
VGERWGCLGIDRPTRFVAAWSFAPSEEQAAPAVVEATRQRTQDQRGIAWVSDGKSVYPGEIKRVYRDPLYTGKVGRPKLLPTPAVQLTQAVKTRVGGKVVGIDVRASIGEQVQSPYANCEERLNGVLRDRLNCLTRKTHGFAKQTDTWDAAVTLSLFEHNWLRSHRALRQSAEGLPDGRRYIRRSPAMAQALTDHIWSWVEFLSHRVNQYRRE